MADNDNRSNNKRKLNKYEDDINSLDKNITTNTKKLKKLSDDIKIINSNIEIQCYNFKFTYIFQYKI